MRDRHTWSLFEDWCTAHDQPALPVSPQSLAQFLQANPAAPATQRRRIAVIDAAHYRRALPPPGRGDTVRAALDAARVARLHGLADRIGGIIERLPESGWPSALFARRDALILTLAATGLPFTQIAALRPREVTVEQGIDALRVETGNSVHTVTPQELVRAGVSPTRVYRHWCEVLGHAARYPSTRMLAEAMTDRGGAALAGYDRYLSPVDVRPLLNPIDRWGHTPLFATALTERGVADIVRSHLDGHAPAHVHPPVRAERSYRHDAPPQSESVITLDPDYHERGTLARRNAHSILDGLDSVLDDVEDRADRLLNELLAFIESDE